MTVAELIHWLQKQPPEAVVFENRGDELREVLIGDLESHPLAQGHPIDEVGYTDEEWDELMRTPIVILGAWA